MKVIRKSACFFVFLLLSCCSSYPLIRYPLDTGLRKTDFNKSGGNSIKYSVSRENVSGDMSYPESGSLPGPRQFGERYLSREFSFTPEAEINNKGVEFLIEGRYNEAGILFREVIKENDKYAPAFNNLGILFELYVKGDACSMYSRACLLDPGNEHYKNNFLSFRDKK